MISLALRAPAFPAVMRRFLALLLCFTLAQPATMAQGLPDLGDPAQAELSPQQERKIGESLFRDIRWGSADYLDDPEVEDYLNKLGNRLVAASTEARSEFQFFALKDPTLNAFAWPGGYIGVNTGLILASDSESELASVVAHEISHVTQRHIVRLYATQGQTSAVALAGLLVAILAARSNSSVSEAAIATTQAFGIQRRLDYTRDFEREADRIGIQTLSAAGFDVRAMASFFERLQKNTRLYDNNAPAYLRTHPLTSERIADIENRITQIRYKQTLDSTDFLLVRAKLRALRGVPVEAVQDLETLVRDKRWPQAAASYGLARAYLRDGKPKAAKDALAMARKSGAESPMLESLDAEIEQALGNPTAARNRYKAALARYPLARSLRYGYLETLLAQGATQEAVSAAAEYLKTTTADVTLYTLAAQAYTAQGKRTNAHRYTAEAYALKGQLLEAIGQLEFARKANDGDFYDLSMVDARLREFKKRRKDELAEQKK
ncbi:MAG: hypothetical protein RIR70_1007 [Pseudomonadota bacterium]